MDIAGVNARCIKESLRRSIGVTLARGNAACIYHALYGECRKKARQRTDWARLGDRMEPISIRHFIDHDGNDG